MFAACFVSYMLRVNMSINILAMVHHHEVEVLGDGNITAIVEPDVSKIPFYNQYSFFFSISTSMSGIYFPVSVTNLITTFDRLV